MTTENKPKRTKQQITDAMITEFHQIATIEETLAELKQEAKDCGYSASLLANIARMSAKGKLDELLEKSQDLIDTVEELDV
jgi:hypothetical protein